MQTSRCIRPLLNRVNDSVGPSKTLYSSKTSTIRSFSAAISPAYSPEESNTASTSSTLSFSSLSSSRAAQSTPAKQSKSKAAVPETPALPTNFFAPYGRIPPPTSDASKVKELLDTLSAGEYTPNDVWNRYCELDHVARDRLPLKLYQGVLRRCTLPPYTFKQRVADPLRKRTKKRDISLHPLEERLLAVLNAMSAAGYGPELEDYNYVMEHYAMTGHYRGARKLMAEMEFRLNRTLPSETFDYAFKAIALHTSLPTHHKREEARRIDVSAAFSSLLQKMQEANLGYTTSVFAAMIPIYRWLRDYKGMENALKLGFGFDIANPDRHPPEFLDRMEHLARQAEQAGQPPPALPQITTSILNNIIMAYGQNGDMGKMITAFEVLTAPLPLPQDASSAPKSFDEAEDDEPIFHDHLHPASNSSLSPLMLSSPPCLPNSRTYHELIDGCLRNDNPKLARHYLKVILERDRQVDAELRRELRETDAPVPSSTIAVSWSMFQNVQTAAERQGKRRMLYWLRNRAREVLEWKRADMEWYSRIPKEELARRGMVDRPFEAVQLPPEDTRVLASATQSVTRPFNRRLHSFVLRGQIRKFDNGLSMLECDVRGRGREEEIPPEKVKARRKQVERKEKAGLVALKRSMDLTLQSS